jgi:hypothetical protein
MMSRRGIGHVAASGSSVKNYGEKKTVGLTDDGECVSARVQRADVKKVLRSAHEMIFGGSDVVLGGDETCTLNKAPGRRARINYAEGQCVSHAHAVADEGGRSEGGGAEGVDRQSLRDLGH